MSKQVKRLRQISISESFSFSKKTKSDFEEKKRITLDMDVKQNSDSSVRNLSALAAEKRIEKSSHSNSPDNVSQELSEENIAHCNPSSQELFPNLSSSEPEEMLTVKETLLYINDALNKDISIDNGASLDLLACKESSASSSQSSMNETPRLNFDDSIDQFLSCHSNSVLSKGLKILNKGACPSATESDNCPSSPLHRSPDCCMPLPKMTPSQNHSIMFSPHIRPGDAPRPYPSEYRDRWDTDHVRMPCSRHSQFPVTQQGERVLCNRWDLIKDSLRSNIKSTLELEQAILKYNSHYAGRWNFRGLHYFINEGLYEHQKASFFNIVLPKMIDMALLLPEICTQSIPLLKKHKDHSLTISQKQIACLILNAFFCTFPGRNSNKYNRLKNSEYNTFPDINFHRLFDGPRNGIKAKNVEKLKCLLNYFSRIVKHEPCGTLTFHRQHLKNLPNWKNSMNKLGLAEFQSHGMIETDGYGMLQVDFANKYIGGGVLGSGCVQEEIRFVICPELIVSRLFTECLDDNEVLIVTGVEQYNKYSGYGDTFKFQGTFEDQTGRDSWGRRYTQMVAMDAKYFNKPDEQYQMSAIVRELNKAYCGFYEPAPPSNSSAIATGNWGCGAFNGTPALKFLIQLMAASEAGRGMLYFTFGSKKLEDELQGMYNFLRKQSLTVGNLWKILEDFTLSMMHFKKDHRPQLFGYIYSLVSESDEQEMKLMDVSSMEECSTAVDSIEANSLDDSS